MIRNKKSINGLGVLSGYAKYLSISALIAMLAALAVSSVCTRTPENCADGQELKPGMFCFDNKAWNKCGGSEYIPYAQFCSGETLYDKCGGKDDYNPQKEFCSGDKVVSKCGNATFDPETQGCVNNIVKGRCGNNHFDPNNEFCFNNVRIYDKCNGKTFDPTIDVCAGEAVKPKCGTGNYDIDTQFCYNNQKYDKCNGNEYNPAESFCSIDIIYALCGGREYDPSRQTCNGANIVDIPKCSSAGYDSTTSFCYNNTVYAKCGGKTYDPSIKTCDGTNIVDLAKFTVYFNANGGMDGADPPKTVTADSGKVIRIPSQQTISRSGYSFGGWNTSPSGAGTYYRVNDQYTVIGDVTLYVKWIPIRTITFHKNGASGVPPEPISGDSGTTITLPGQGTMTMSDGSRLGGWNTNYAGTGIRYSADSAYTVTGNVILYAIWDPYYRLRIDVSPLGGGSVNSNPSDDSYRYGTSVTITAIAEKGYVFIGWFGAFTSTSTSETITMDGNKTLTAKFIYYSTGTFTDSRDGKKYKNVTLNGKTWMAENLNYQIPNNSWCYENADSNCVKYGRLYAWNTTGTVCPSGWHLPTSQEWKELAFAVGATTGTYGENGVSGIILKSKNGWSNNGNGTDLVEFSALPGGIGYSNSSYDNAGIGGYWWTATERSISDAYYRYMRDWLEYMSEANLGKTALLSVRCIQD